MVEIHLVKQLSSHCGVNEVPRLSSLSVLQRWRVFGFCSLLDSVDRPRFPPLISYLNVAR